MPAPPATAIVVVGSEILAGHTLDTNSQYLARAAFAAGYPVRWVEVVGDDVAQIARAVARGAADLAVSRVAVCGGVGPTPDDRTREGVAAGLGVELVEHPGALAVVAARTRTLFDAGWGHSPEVSAANRKMALAPAGARVLSNRSGMAPPLALALPGDDRWLVVLPGVPREFIAIVDEAIIPEFFAGGAPPTVVELRYTGIPEADFAEPMTILAAEFPAVTVGSYPQPQRGELIIRLHGNDAAAVDAAAARLGTIRPA